MENKSTKIADSRLQLRSSLWPDVPATQLWHRKQRQGFTTLPRTMPLILRAMDFLAPKGKPVGGVFLELWCRTFDEMMIILDKPHEMAFASGFAGQRAVQTWGERIDILAKLGFIKLAAGPYGARSYALILNPYLILKPLRGKIAPAIYNALVDRAAVIKADDLNDNVVPIPFPMPKTAPPLARPKRAPVV
jgi:hypothetical protein